MRDQAHDWKQEGQKVTLQLTEVIGTNGADTLPDFDNFFGDRSELVTRTAFYGQGGDDTFRAATVTNLTFARGGAGNDTYIADDFLSTLFIDASDGGSDTLVYPGFFTDEFEMEILEVDGRHLALMDFFGQWVIILDYRTANIGSVQLGDGTFSYASSLQDIRVDDSVTWQQWITNFAENPNITGDLPPLGVTGAELADAVERFLNGPDGNGTAGDDDLRTVSDDRSNYLDGRAGNDTIFGGDGEDTLLGGIGDDFIVGGRDATLIDGGDGADFLIVRGNGDTIEGGAGDDVVILGAGGERSLDGGEGADLLAGTSAIPFEASLLDGTYEIFFNEGVQRIRTGTFSNFENLAGGDLNDTLRGDNGDNRVGGFEGDDNIFGLDGNDFLLGNIGRDRLIGGVGNDTALGEQGNDTMFAGPGDTGNDIYVGGNHDDLIGAGAGNDLVVGDFALTPSFSSADVSSASGADTLFGGAGDDTLIGGGWNDLDDSGSFDVGEAVVNVAGSNVGYAGSGADRVYGGSASDILGGGVGNDTLSGGPGHDIFYGGRSSEEGSDDIISGGFGNDTIFGGSGSDNMMGEGGTDLIFGGGADDTVDGGAGSDGLYGGGGNDVIITGSGSDTVFSGGAHGMDTVQDFNADTDTLFLQNTVTDFTSVQDIAAAATETEQGGETGLLIDTGDGNSLFVVNLTESDLSDTNTVF